MKNEPRQGGALLQLTAAMLIFGSLGVLVRSMALPSSFVAAVRGLVGMLFMLPIVLLKKPRTRFTDIRRSLPLLLLTGVLLGVNWMLLFEAYRYTTVAKATLCYYMAPVLMILVSPFLLGEKITVRKAFCVVVAVAGMIPVSGVLQRGQGEADFKGILLGIGAAALYCCVVILNKKQRDVNIYDSTLVQLGAAAAVLVPYTLLTEDISALRFPPGTLLMLALAGVLHTGIAYALYFGSIQRLKTQTVAIFSYIDPVVAILSSALILKEKLGFASVIGTVLVLGSAAVSELPAARRDKAKSAE